MSFGGSRNFAAALNSGGGGGGVRECVSECISSASPCISSISIHFVRMVIVT